MFNFKALLEAWRGGGLVAEMYKEFQVMLERASEIFETATKALAGEVKPEDVWEEVRARDKEINRIQRQIRRQVVEHLSLKSGADVPVSLILMSIVKDAERLGDYGRDLFKVAYLCPNAAGAAGFGETIGRLETETMRLMADARKALADTDEELAREVMGREDALKAECDKMLEDVVGAGLSGAETVAMTLISRYIRRLIAHTANIASGVINPVERLDYKPKD